MPPVACLLCSSLSRLSKGNSMLNSQRRKWDLSRPLPGSSSLCHPLSVTNLSFGFFLFRGLLFHFLTYLLDLTQVSISYCRSCSVLVFCLQRLLIFFFIACLSLDLGERRDANIPCPFFSQPIALIGYVPASWAFHRTWLLRSPRFRQLCRIPLTKLDSDTPYRDLLAAFHSKIISRKSHVTF